MQVLFVIACAVIVVLPWCAVQGTPDEEYTWGAHGDERNPSDGTYSFYYEVPGHSSRAEERELSSEEDSNEVEGYYSFVSPEGEKFEFKYEAGVDGFIVESNALPKAPEDTDEVKQAKKEFFAAYCKALGEEDCDISEYDKIETHDEEESDEDSSEEDGEDSSEEEENNIGGYRFKRKSIKGGSFNKNHNLGRSLESRYNIGLFNQKQKQTGDQFQRQRERNANTDKILESVIFHIQRDINNTLPSHRRIQNWKNMKSQNSFGKKNEWSLSENRKLFDNTANIRKSNHGRPGVRSSYQTSHGTGNFNKKLNDHHSLKMSHDPKIFPMRQPVLDTLNNKRQNIKSSLPIHDNEEIAIQNKQGLGDLFAKSNISKSIEKSMQNKKSPNTHMDLKSLNHNNQHSENIDDGIQNLYRKLEDTEKSISNSSINLKPSLRNNTVKSLNNKNYPKASLRSSPILKDTNKKVQNKKDERSQFHRRRGHGLQLKQKVKSVGYVIEEPGLHHSYSVTYGEQ